MANPQLFSGLPLLVGGTPAVHSDCCCTDCTPEGCLDCFNCWNDETRQCRAGDNIAITIDGIAEPGFVDYGDGCPSVDCDCDSLNGTYILDLTTCDNIITELYGCECGSANDPGIGGCQGMSHWYANLSIEIDKSATSQVFTDCDGNTVTIPPGHFVKVTLQFFERADCYDVSSVSRWDAVWMHSFDNYGPVTTEACPDGIGNVWKCSPLTLGDAIFLGWKKQTSPGIGSCRDDLFPTETYFCDLSAVTVTIDSITLEP